MLATLRSAAPWRLFLLFGMAMDGGTEALVLAVTSEKETKTMANANEKLTITLTGRPPVKITKDEWPVVAIAEDKEFDNEHEFQANRISKSKLIVRQHKDGRAIVYGIYTYETQWQGSRCYNIRGGEYLGSEADIPLAIEHVGQWMEEQRPQDLNCGGIGFTALIHQCTADLPAVEI